MSASSEEQLSALLDNGLTEAEAGLVVRRLCRNPDLRELALRYCLVGDVLRDLEGEVVLLVRDRRVRDLERVQDPRELSVGELDVEGVLQGQHHVDAGVGGHPGLVEAVGVRQGGGVDRQPAVLGDDLALNAQQVSGVHADRELPVVWAVAKGSFINKTILVPAALAISAFAPWAVTPLLMVGGLFLCYEGVEKLAHKFGRHGPEEVAHRAELTHALIDPEVDIRPVRGQVDDLLAEIRERVPGCL